MATRKWLIASLVLSCTSALAQEPLRKGAARPDAAIPQPADTTPEAPPKAAPSRVTAVTVYQGNALVTRLVDVPDGKGLIEIVVTPLPPQTVDSSLYADGTDGLRVLSSRYRTRAVKEDTRKEVRAKEAEIRTLKLDAERLKNEAQVADQNLQLLSKLENFTSVTMQHLAEKGLLNSEATLSLAKYVMTTRVEKAAALVVIQQKIQGNAEATEFATRELTELTSGSARTERDAVIVVDRGGAGGKVRLNYLVTAATWRPQYRFRAGGENDAVQLEYLAAIEQKSGEDWTGVDMTLSTAQPQLNATPPELLALDITVVGQGAGLANAPQQNPGSGMMGGGMGGGMASMGGRMGNGQMFRDQSRELRQEGQRRAPRQPLPEAARISSTKRPRSSRPMSCLPGKTIKPKTRTAIEPAGSPPPRQRTKGRASPIISVPSSRSRRATTSSSSKSPASRPSPSTITKPCRF